MAKPRKSLVKHPPLRTKDQLSRIEAAITELLSALGHEPKGDLKKTPKRVAKLWTEELLAGETLSSEQILTQSTMKSKATSPVCVTNLGTYLICPHHLTVAFGTTHIAYEPNGKLTGFGALADLVQANTARLIFQEEATENIAEAIANHLDAKAVVVMMTATHPCHTLNHPRAHSSKIITWSDRGPKNRISSLKQLLKLTLED